MPNVESLTADDLHKLFRAVVQRLIALETAARLAGAVPMVDDPELGDWD